MIAIPGLLDQRTPLVQEWVRPTAMGKNELSTLAIDPTVVLNEFLLHLSKQGLPNSRKKKSEVPQRCAKWLPQDLLRMGAGSDEEREKAKKAAAFARSYLLVVLDHFPQLLSDFGRLISILDVSLRFPNDEFEKYAKWYCVAPIAKHLQNPLPPRPAGLVVGCVTKCDVKDLESRQDLPLLFPFEKKLVRFFDRVLLNRKSRKALHFFNSLLQGVKRGCSEPSKQMILKQLQGHSRGLSKEPEPFNQDYRPYLNRALEGIKKLSRGSLKDTGGASFSTSRSLGGKFEEAVRAWNGVSFDEPLNSFDLYFMDEKGRSLYGRPVPTWRELRSLVSERREVRVVGLLEALKVRVITTGDASESLYLEPHRKKLHDFLREVECLKLIGSPKVKSGDLRSLCRKETELGLNRHWRSPAWVSGDYSAATDNLNLGLTKQCIEVICQKLGCKDDEGVMRASLTETQLVYPKESDLAVTPQKNGQLMGNPLSFPILCLANLVGYWKSLETYLKRQVALHELPVLINGDDILFRADDEFLKLWQGEIKAIGFTLSVGKYYVHPRVATLNSQLFVDFKEVTYTNPGLLVKGFAGSKKKVEHYPIDAIYDEFLRGAWSKPQAFRRLNYYWKGTLEKATEGRLNLFLPRSCGGLGLKPVDGVDFYVSPFQRWLAWALMRVQTLHPERGKKLTQTPMREDFNSRVSLASHSTSDCLYWLEDGNHDDLFKRLGRKGLVPDPFKSERLEITKLMNEAFQVDDLRAVRHFQGVISKLKTRTIESSDFLRDHERAMISLTTGAARMERSFDPKIDAIWWRRLTGRHFKMLRRRYGVNVPESYQIPRERRLMRYFGPLSSI